MIGRISRGFIVVAGMAATVVSLPAESKACWLFGCAPRTTYRPIWGASYSTFYGGSSCCSSGCGTGCCSTSFFAPSSCNTCGSSCGSICGSSCGSSCGTCNTCNHATFYAFRPACTTGCFSPVTVRFAPVVPAASSCCTPTSAPLSSGTTYLPSTSTAPNTMMLPSTNAPSTFAPGPVAQPEPAVQPVPDATNGSTTKLPRVSEPEGRVTMLPRNDGIAVRTAVYNAEVGARAMTVAAEAPKTLDDGGWRASKR